MALDGDIVEYENLGVMDAVGTGGTDVELLLYFINHVQLLLPYSLLRLNGGRARVEKKKKRSYLQMIGAAYNRTKSWYSDFSEKANRRYVKARSRIKEALQSGLTPIKKTNQFLRMIGIEDDNLNAMERVGADLSKAVDASPPRLFPSLTELEEAVASAQQTVEAALGSPTDMVVYDPAVGAKVVPYESPALPENTLIDPNYMPGNAGGMLNLKNSLTKRLRTHCYYDMSHLMWTKKTVVGTDTYYNHKTDWGSGPHLYMSYNRETVAGFRNTNFNTPNGWDQGMDPHTVGNASINRGVGWNNTVYIFAADWPFLMMNHDPLTQDLTNGIYGRFLAWEYVTYATTNENNPPIQLNNFITNKDWTYLTHYKTDYTFDFMNTSLNTYFVEVLFFKFKADPDAMNYYRQTLAVSRRQPYKVGQWIYGIGEIPADITIVHRKRIMLGPVSNYSPMKNFNTMTPSMLGNVAQYKFSLKRKYVMKRPILNTFGSMSEAEFFNTYYEPNKGIYCRVQSFTLDAAFGLKYDFESQWYDDEDTINRPTTERDGTNSNGKGVGCKLEKVSYFKLDENIYKSYASG